jgi:hypothetical protein
MDSRENLHNSDTLWLAMGPSVRKAIPLQKVDSLLGLLDEREAIKFSVPINSFAMIT